MLQDRIEQKLIELAQKAKIISYKAILTVKYLDL